MAYSNKKLKFAFRLVHIDNIPHIIKYGIVKEDSPYAAPDYVAIGDQLVIEKRKLREIGSQKKVGDYIPFYFGPRSPMLYVIQHGYSGVKRIEATQLVYCVIRLDDLIKNKVPCLFSDGHVLNKLTQVFDGSKLKDVDRYVAYDDVFSLWWDDEVDTDLKRRKEAELLVDVDLPVDFIRGFVVFDESAKHVLISMGVDSDKVVIKANYYY